MAAVGGPIDSVNISGREFAVAEDAESNRKLGGFENENSPNGNGSSRLIKTRIAWMLDGINVEIDDSRNDSEYLQDIADGNDYVTISITYASGITYQGTGQITGEFAASSKNATAPITLGGPGKLTQQ